MKQDHLYCSSCPYFKRGYVAGEGPEDATLMLIGEAPGQDESFRSHRPFTGPAGMELDRYLKGAGIAREGVYVTNLVKCNPPGNEDPLPEVIKKCKKYLMQEFATLRAEVLVTLGAASLRALKPELDIEMVWGIPQFYRSVVYEPKTEPDWDTALFPLYHPALGLHMTRMLPQIEQGFDRLGRWLRGEEVWRKDSIDTHYDTSEGMIIGGGRVGQAWDRTREIAADTETTWDGKPLYVQMSSRKGQATLFKPGILPPYMMERKRVLTILHNAMYDLEVLHQMGVHPARVVDTMVMAYLLGDLPQGLKPLAYRLCGMEMKGYEEVIGVRGNAKARAYLEGVLQREWPDPEQVLEFKDGEPHIRKPQGIVKKITRAIKDSEKGEVDLRERWSKMDGTEIVESALGPMPGADLRDVPSEEAINYACRDADATLRIYPILKRRIEEEGLEEVLRMDMGAIPMVLDMQRTGIKVDLKEMGKVNTLLTRKMGEKEREIQKLLGYHINPGSPKQIAEMMDREGITGRKKRGKSGQQSTAKEILEPLRLQYPVIGHILDWGGYETLRSTFTEVLPTKVGVDGRIHPTIKVTRTSTGRLAMENPNLQNIPVRSEEGKMIRDAFVAEDGYVLCSFDYAQIEMRMAAHCSGDPVMLQVFRDGVDIHSATASKMFGISMSEVDEMKHRYPAKRVGFGVLYGISGPGLAIQMDMAGAKGWTADSCQGLIDSWFRVYRGVDDFMEEGKAHARRYGYITDMFGRRRWTPEVHSSNKRIVEEGLRYAMNQPIQSGAQGVIKLAMGRIWEELLPYLGAGVVRCLLQIHDDLLFEVREEEIEWVIPLIQGVMESVVRLAIPTPVDPKMGHQWGNMKKLG